MKRRSFLVLTAASLAGCSGSGGSSPTPTDSPTPSPTPSPTETRTPNEEPTPSPTPESQLDIDPEATVVDFSEAVAIGNVQVEVSSWVRKQRIRYYDSESDSLSFAHTESMDTVWFQAGGEIANLGGSQIPYPSLRDFTLHDQEGEVIPIFELSEIGSWDNLREDGMEYPIDAPGWTVKYSDKMDAGGSDWFDLLFSYDGSEEVYLEWEPYEDRDSVYIHIDMTE